MIQQFEMVHELAWNVLKDYFEYQGNTTITGSRDASRERLQNGLIRHGEGWMSMIKSRNQSSHTYYESVANELKDKILNEYYVLFKEFKEVLFKLRS